MTCGPNASHGSGKTTPLKILEGALAPEGDAVIYRGRPIHVAGWAKRFLFREEQLEMPVASLSSGERARVLIARLMLKTADVVLLDEPTNDLDIPTLEVPEESLLEFQGALVLVSHDRHLLDRVSTLVIGLDGTGEAGVFADYSQWEAWRDEQSRETSGTNERRGPAPATGAQKKLSYIEQREWDGMEEKILEAEQELAAWQREVQGFASDSERLPGGGRCLSNRPTSYPRSSLTSTGLFSRLGPDRGYHVPGWLAQVSAFSVFLGIAAIGFLFLLVTLIFGEVFEHFDGSFDHALDHGGPGFFSTRIMSVFVTAFGGFGAVGIHYGLSMLEASGVGFGSGAFFATLILLFARFLYGQQATTKVLSSDLVDSTARVVVAIPANGVGQVRCQIGEEVFDKVARSRSGEAVPENAIVTVEETLGEVVIVRPR